MDTATGDSLLKQLQVAEEGTILFPIFQTATMTCLSLQGCRHYVTAQLLFGSGSTKLFIRVLRSAEYLQVAEELFQLLDESGRGLVARVYSVMISSMSMHANHIMFS